MPDGSSTLERNPVLQSGETSHQTPVPVYVVGGGAGGGAVTIADGANVTQGALADAAVVTDASGSLSAKLRGLIVILLRAFALGTPLRVDPTGGTTQPVSVAATLLVAGPTASGSSLTASPQTTGGLAKTANPTAVTDGQVVNATYDKLGKQIVVGAIRDLKVVEQTTISSSTSETTIGAAGGSGVFKDVYGLIITNTSATVCKVTIKDDTAGTTRAVFEIPATETRGFMLPVDSAVTQAVANKPWTATCGTSVAGIEITLLSVKNL